MNLKIQNLAGNTLMSRFHVGFEIELPLVRSQIHLKNYSSTLSLGSLQSAMSKNVKYQKLGEHG